MMFDEILEVVGKFRRWHKIIFLAIIFIHMTIAQHMVATVFYQARPDFRCRLPNENSNAKYNLSKEEMDKNYPIDQRTKTYDPCKMYENGTNSKAIECVYYIYDNSVYTETATTLFNMVCSQLHLSATADALFMVGYLIGSFNFGWLSDRFGRKPVLYFCLVLQVASSVWVIFSINYLMYVVGRFGDGAATAGVYIVSYVLVTEMVVPHHRLYAGQMTQIAFSCGYMLTALYAYLLRSCRHFYGLVCAPGIIFLGYWFFMPESPRWLITTNRLQAAKENVRRIAKWNKVELSAELWDVFERLHIGNINENRPTNKVKIIHICRYKKLRTESILLFFSWFSIATTYFGLTLLTNQLKGNDFVLFLISGIADFIGCSLVVCTVNIWGRRYTYCVSMITAGVFLISISCIPEEINWLIVTFAMIGKCACAYAFSVAYIYSVELYPTLVRNAGLGACSTFARIGTIIAPYLGLTMEYWRPCPMLIMGLLVLISGLLSFNLPETLNKKLPETLEEGENFGVARQSEF